MAPIRLWPWEVKGPLRSGAEPEVAVLAATIVLRTSMDMTEPTTAIPPGLPEFAPMVLLTSDSDPLASMAPAAGMLPVRVFEVLQELE